MKIVIFESEAWERTAFSGLESMHQMIYERERLDSSMAERYSDADIISTFIYSQGNAEVLRQFPRLKLIATRSTGVDHLDTHFCAANGIHIANVPSYGENTVAEHVFALLLAISHHLIEAVDRTRRGDFSQEGLKGFDLYGKTFGLIGTGKIGRHAARIAKGFGMDVIAFDIEPDTEAAQAIGFRYLSLEEVLRRSDILSLHVPYNEATHHLIDADAFAKMRDGAVLINTARGAVVDVRALLEALSRGKIAAAGLDVLPEEPIIREEAELLRATFSRAHDLGTLLADHILLRLRNVLITPHSAFNTQEAVGRILEVTRANIEAFLAGKPQNLVEG